MGGRTRGPRLRCGVVRRVRTTSTRGSPVVPTALRRRPRGQGGASTRAARRRLRQRWGQRPRRTSLGAGRGEGSSNRSPWHLPVPSTVSAGRGYRTSTSQTTNPPPWRRRTSDGSGVVTRNCRAPPGAVCPTDTRRPRPRRRACCHRSGGGPSVRTLTTCGTRTSGWTACVARTHAVAGVT